MSEPIGTLNPKNSPHKEEVAHLIRSVLVPGEVTYFYDRADYDAFARFQGSRYTLFSRRSESGELIGVTQITEDEVSWEGQTQPIAYSGDTRISPTARGRGLIDDLMKSAFQGVERPVLGAIFESNKVVLDKKIHDWKKIGIHFQSIAVMDSFFHRAKKWKGVTSGSSFQVRQAEEVDLPEMYELWKKESKTKNLMRNYESLDRFIHSYQTVQGTGLHKTFVAIDSNKRIIGFMSAWNQSEIRKVRIHSYSLVMRVLRALIRPWINLPLQGEEVKVQFAYQQCVDSQLDSSQSIWAELTRAVRGHVYENGGVFFASAYDRKDPACSVIRKTALATNSVRIVLHDPLGKLDVSKNQPLHIEVGLG